MISHRKCVLCALKQIERIAHLSNLPEKKIKEIKKKAIYRLCKDYKRYSPAKISSNALSFLYAEIKNDPFKKIKENQNMLAQEFLDKSIKPMIYKSKDPLLSAIKWSILGNLIDDGANPDYNTQNLLLEKARFCINHYDKLKQELKNAKTVLYILDNSGEAIFDREVVKIIGEERTIVAARDDYILNDITYKEAQTLGFKNVISTGNNTLGIDFDKVSYEFIESFRKANIIIAKGQANFESLWGIKKQNLFFLLNIKCNVVGKIINSEYGCSIIINEIKYKT